MLTIARNPHTGVTYTFDRNTAPVWAVAYAYCDEHYRLSQLFVAAQDSQLEALYGTLPLKINDQGTISCGDWVAGTEET